MKAVLSGEFLEKFRSGQKEFDGMILQYAELNGNDFSGIKLRDSRLFFSNFRDCNFRDAVFDKCEMFFVGFKRSDFTNARIIDSKIEYSGLSAFFSNTKITGTSLSWIEMIEAIGKPEMLNCSEFKVVRSISEIRQEDADEAIRNLGPFIQHLDFDEQQRIRKVISVISERLHVKPSEGGPADTEQKAAYPARSGYGVMDLMVKTAIGMYGAKPAYKTKRSYETESKYK